MLRQLSKAALWVGSIAATGTLSYQAGKQLPDNPKKLSVKQVRERLPSWLDAAGIGADLIIPSFKQHSGRYHISPWQRGAATTEVCVLHEDSFGQLWTVLGKQNRTLQHPQGYMELPLPEGGNDLTGLEKLGASRYNGSTGKPIQADLSVEAAACREAFEETGLIIEENDLVPLFVRSFPGNNPNAPGISHVFFAQLATKDSLSTTDHEFTGDLEEPRWVSLGPASNPIIPKQVDGIPVNPTTEALIINALKPRPQGQKPR